MFISILINRAFFFQLLQKTISDQSQSIREQESLIVRLTAKLERSEDQLSGLQDQLQRQSLDLTALRSAVQDRDRELDQARSRHEQDIERLKATDSGNVQEEIHKILEQQLQDANAALESKIQTIESLQNGIVGKDKDILELQEATQMLKDKLAASCEQLASVQENCTQMEAQLHVTKRELSERQESGDTAAHTSGSAASAAEMAQLQAAVAHYQAAYAQLQSQHASLQERLNTKPRAMDGASSTPDLELIASKEKLQQELDRSLVRITDLEKQLGESSGTTGASKPDAKFMKYKAQATSKIKTLEKKIEELKQVGCVSSKIPWFNLVIPIFRQL